MALNIMDLFKSIKWAKNGDVTDMSRTNYEAGWSHLGDDTPTVEDFNLVQKLNDEKDQWLFSQIKAVCDAKGIEVTESDAQALLKAINTSATLSRAGITQLSSALDSTLETMAATPKAVKTLKDLIDGLTRNLGDYIPNSKKSNVVNSNSEDMVATSVAVKTAYDKGVEAKTAADAAQRTANDGVSKATTAQNTANNAVTKADNAQQAADNANNNANNRVSKSGDTMNGSLAITGSQSGDFANGLILKNKAGGQNTGAFVDFYQSDAIPRSSIWFRDAGNNSTQIEFLNTPEGSDWNRDSRQGVFTITSAGSLWSRAYGWLHEKFASKSEVYAKSRFRQQWYGNYYEGAAVFDVPMADNGVMRTIIMAATIDGYAKLNLPESFNGVCRVQVMDVGIGRRVIGANIQNGNVVEVFTQGRTGLNITAIGWYGW